MTKMLLDEVEAMYSSNIKKMGISSRSVGWNTHECQYLRFEKLTELIVDRSYPISVNDLGCGYGEMAKYFGENGIHLRKYCGVDISDEMLIKGKDYLKDLNDVEIAFKKGSKLECEADFSFASGIFNVKFKAKESDWILHIEETLQNMNSYSTKGFAFNLLTTFVDYQDPHLFYGDPCYFFTYCKKHFSPKVTLIHDYPLWEWTIIVRKDA